MFPVEIVSFTCGWSLVRRVTTIPPVYFTATKIDLSLLTFYFACTLAKMAMVKDGHQNRLREEIVAYLEEYFEESGLPKPDDLESYIQEQTATVLARMYAEDEINPDEEDPETVPGDYYRESIADYGTVFTDYTLDDEE